MNTVRQPAVAGLFYPAAATALERMMQACMEGARAADSHASPVLVVPHAGLPFSGPVAATAYRKLHSRAAPRRVALIGPSHRVAFGGMALSSASAFRTPLGDLPVDYPRALAGMHRTRMLDAAHAKEHSLEVQLPFLQRQWAGSVPIAPVVVGDASANEVADVIELLLAQPDTLLLVSTDLSHFHVYDEACRIDAATVSAIEDLRGDIRPDQACGCRPLNGLIEYCRRQGRGIEALDVRNSGDTAGGRERVVGYAAMALQ